jgi:hypothetical protein
MIKFSFLPPVKLDGFQLSICFCEYFERCDHFTRFQQTLDKIQGFRKTDIEEFIVFYPDLSAAHLSKNCLLYNPAGRQVKIKPDRPESPVAAAALYEFLLLEPRLKQGLRHLRVIGLH